MLLGGLVFQTAAIAAPAGTRITNTASLHYTAAGGEQALDSNSVAIVVAERLDLTLAAKSGGVPVKGATTTVAATLTNTGNGQEAFAVQASAPGARVVAVAIDGDGDGRYDSAHDTLLLDGRTAALAPGASVALVAVLDTGASADGAVVTLAASAATGSGTPGTDFPGAGDGGGDAVVGSTGAAAHIDIPIGNAAAAPTLVKSQSVRAPDGSVRAIAGAIVTYVLEARFTGATAQARIDDPIPPGTRYVAGSLTLDAAALSDAADADAGSVDATTVSVALGAITAPVVHTVQFQVQIQ